MNEWFFTFERRVDQQLLTGDDLTMKNALLKQKIVLRLW